MNYKQEHEAFVSGLKGSSPFVIIYIGIAIVIINGMRKVIEQSNNNISWSKGLLLDYLFIILPTLVLLCYFETIAFWMCLLFLLLFIITIYNKKSVNTVLNNEKIYKIPFLTTYRSSLLLITCLAIIAVDFHIFPRYFAKTETYGYSLMDIGVGSFVFSNAIVSKKARNIGNHDKLSYSQRIIKSIQSTSPLIILGFIRLYSTKATDYQEHVSEYGVHWNFFFTLSIVSLLVTMFDIPSSLSPWVSLIIMLLYQTSLYYGLEDWIINSPRDNIISMNKEGICSSIGYFCICLLGTWIGSLLFLQKYNKTSSQKLNIHLISLDIIFWILCYISNYYIPSSRRMVNITYILFILGFNLLLIILFRISDQLLHPISSNLMNGLQRNGLFLFLLANLLTGAINLSIHTLYVPNNQAIIILGIYLLILTIVTTILHKFNITLKFW